MNASLQRVFDEAGTDPSPSPCRVSGKLAEKKTGNGIGRLPGADRPRQNCRDNRRWCQTVVADHPSGIMHDKHRCKSFLLIGKGACLQPMIKRRLAAGKLGNIMRGGNRFGRR